MMHDQMPAVMIAHSTIFEPVRKDVSGYEIDPFGKHIFSGRYKINSKCQSARRGGFIFLSLTFTIFVTKLTLLFCYNLPTTAFTGIHHAYSFIFKVPLLLVCWRWPAVHQNCANRTIFGF
jgi:hypothetical protein